jgi:hypothetical protein
MLKLPLQSTPSLMPQSHGLALSIQIFPQTTPPEQIFSRAPEDGERQRF